MKRIFTSSSSLWSCFFALAMVLASQSAWAEYVKLTALDGVGGTGGEGYAKLVDTKTSSKWGHWFDPYGNTADSSTESWVIVKAEKAVVPEWYFLVTGNDTGSNPGRNWEAWKIYGGNFQSDADAVRGADGWVLIDNKDGEPLPAADFGVANLQFSEAPKEAYQYYWIEVERTVEGANVYQQMSEWGLGSKGDLDKYLDDLANLETGTDEPVVYNIIEGTAGNGDGEALDKLFDGDITTKYGFFWEGSPYFIVKTSRAIVPSYCKLVTGTDNASWKNRGWKTWKVYGMASAYVAGGKPARESDNWVLIDDKNVTAEEMPDKNMFTVFFNLDPGTSEAYQYFKVEIGSNFGDTYCQLGEFALGDEYTFALDKNALASAAEAVYDPDLFAEKALLDQMADLIAQIKATTSPFALGSLNDQVGVMTDAINASAGSYAELVTARNVAINYISDDNLNAEAETYVTAWISETDVIAPNAEYPVGNFAYIKANRQLTGAEALAEAKRVNEYILANVKVIDAPIYATYEALSGSGGFGGEEHDKLIDGDSQSTKWCTTTIPGYLIFKSSEPIKPTYYGLVTGSDTYSYPDRNWKTWKIYAANFDSDEEATRESDKWVLIDEKNNVGTDVLKTYNVYESYINLSIGCTEPYEYFRIEVESAGGGTMQMNEFTFYNLGNLNEYRGDFISEFDGYDPEAEPAYIGYINDYKEKYETLLNATNAPDVMKAYNDLKEIMDAITASAEKYANYQSVYDELSNTNIESESLSTWFEGYSSENEGPNVKYIRGTYEYILENLYLDNDGIDTETKYLQDIINACNEGLYILLGGHTVGEWGDGFYGNLIDGIALNTEGTDDEGNPITINATKWGGQADEDGDTYIIFRTASPVNPYFYTLTTGNDTGSYPGRNWGTWYIYGANFEYDGNATKDAEDWVLIDMKENVGQDRLHPLNAQPSYFGFSTETTEEYMYYKVVVTKAYSGNAIQMNELHFGTENEFEEIKSDYIAAANEFDYEVVAEQALIDQYEAAIGDIDECLNMEALFRANNVVESLQEQITKSAAAYASYQEQVDAAKTYLEENNLADSEAKTIFVNYLNEDEEASELYPNGTAMNILDEHVLADSVVLAEVDFLESLKTAAVAAGYGKGTDISSLIVNRTFAKAGSTLKDENGNNIGRVAEGWDGYIFRTGNADGSNIYAAEFCNENAKFDISQTLSGMKNGFYQLKLNAAYRANGSRLSYNYAAMAYANDVATFLPVVREDAAHSKEDAWLTGNYQDNVIYQCDIETPTGDPAVDSVEVAYIIWSCEGAAHAFQQGRYAVTLVTQVTDGTLTFGVKNEGTKGNEWTAAGNFGLVYLGETEEDAAAALAQTAEYNAARIATLTELYESSTEAEDYSDAPGFGAAQKAILAGNSGAPTYEAEKTISETMQSVYKTKNAYLDLFNASEKVYLKWFEYAGVYDAEDAVYDVRDSLEAGAYADEEAAKETKAQFYAEYPSYLEITDSRLLVKEQEGFTFDITTAGNSPYLDLKNLYEPLKEDEVILAFDYVSEKAIESSRIYYNAPNFLTDVVEELEVIPAASEWQTAYVTVQKGISSLNFGSATDHGIRWYIYYQGTSDASLQLKVRNFRFVTKAQMKAEGGKTLNGIEGDLNGDGKIDIADAVTVLNVMADGTNDSSADLNDDGKVDIADFVTVLNLMAEN